MTSYFLQNKVLFSKLRLVSLEINNMTPVPSGWGICFLFCFFPHSENLLLYLLPWFNKREFLIAPKEKYPFFRFCSQCLLVGGASELNIPKHSEHTSPKENGTRLSHSAADILFLLITWEAYEHSLDYLNHAKPRLIPELSQQGVCICRAGRTHSHRVIFVSLPEKCLSPLSSCNPWLVAMSLTHYEGS